MSTDQAFLLQALQAAKPYRGRCAPNPAVGAVIVKDGDLLAEGAHHAPGQPHAEVTAVQQSSDAELVGATIYVTLEPCCHWGRTPPCTELLIEKRFARVVYAQRDPNPQVDGGGEAQLRAAGIEVQQVEVAEISDFYRSYRHWLQYQRPWVSLKMALSMDGFIAESDGQAVALSDTTSNDYTHQCRWHSDAMLTTAATVNADNPQLNARVGEQVLAKPIYLIDRHAGIDLSLQLFDSAASITLLHGETAPAERLDALIERGVRLIAIDEVDGGLDLKQVIDQIGQDGVHDLWVEVGAHVFTSLLSQELADRILLYVCPLELGDGLAAFQQAIDFSRYQLSCRDSGDDEIFEFVRTSML